MYAPHTLTLYNTEENSVTYETESYITVLEGVFWDAALAANTRATGLENADALNLFIPFSVKAYDGETGEPKSFLPEKEFAVAANKNAFWTLSTSNCFVVKGVAVLPGKSFQEVNKAFGDVHRVTKVDIKDFGSENMWHWEVGGR